MRKWLTQPYRVLTQSRNPQGAGSGTQRRTRFLFYLVSQVLAGELVIVIKCGEKKDGFETFVL